MIDVGENLEGLINTIFHQVDEDALLEQELIIISYLCEERHVTYENERIAGSQFLKKYGRLYNDDLVNAVDNISHIESKKSSAGKVGSKFQYKGQSDVQEELLSGKKLDSIQSTLQKLNSISEKQLHSEVENSREFETASHGNYLFNDAVRSMNGYRLFATSGFLLSWIVPLFWFLGFVELYRHLVDRTRADNHYNKALYAGLMRGAEITSCIWLFVVGSYFILLVVAEILA